MRAVAEGQIIPVCGPVQGLWLYCRRRGSGFEQRCHTDSLCLKGSPATLCRGVN